MKALVTGATGFIGSHLVEALAKRGYSVTCLVRRSSDLRWLRHIGPDYLHADLEDIGAHAEELKRFDYIFHLAGLTKATSERDFFQANATCTDRLVTAAAGACKGLKRFVHVSSLAAAGPSLSGIPVSEEDEPRPVSIYGRSKLEGEKAVISHAGRVPVTIVRPPAVYGPRDTDFFLVFRAVSGGIFPYWGRASYSLIYVGDLVSGIILSAESGTAEGRTYYLADSSIYTNDDILHCMTEAMGKRAVRLRLPRAVLPVLAAVIKKIGKKGIINPDKIQEIRYPHWTCDPARAMKELGFRTETPLGEGLKITADWYRKEKWI